MKSRPLKEFIDTHGSPGNERKAHYRDTWGSTRVDQETEAGSGGNMT